MNTPSCSLKLAAACLISLWLGACGGKSGGSSSFETKNNSPANVNNENIKALSKGAVTGVEGSLRSLFSIPLLDNVGDGVDSSSGAEKFLIKPLSNALSDAEGLGLIGVPQSFTCSAGGSFTIDFEFSGPEIPESGSGTLLYDECSFGTSVLDGYIAFSYSGGWDLQRGPQKIEIDYSVTISGARAERNISCSDYGETCSSTEIFRKDGRRYEVVDAEINGDSLYGYTFAARIYNGRYGYLIINGDGLRLCERGGLKSGTIFAEDESGHAVFDINFEDCGQFSTTVAKDLPAKSN